MEASQAKNTAAAENPAERMEAAKIPLENTAPARSPVENTEASQSQAANLAGARITGTATSLAVSGFRTEGRTGTQPSDEIICQRTDPEDGPGA